MFETISKTIAATWPAMAVLAALVAAILSPGMRDAARTGLRFMAYPLMLLAAVALIYDATRTASGDAGLVVTSLGEHWETIAPANFEATKALVARRGAAWLWDTIVLGMLRLPGWLALGGLGLALSYAGRRRRTANVFAN
jgi:hypothetical protein